MNIKWQEVTWYSQIVAIVLFIGIFALGFYLGQLYQNKAYENGEKAVVEEIIRESKAAQE
jgi:hypothetical protein